MKAKEIISKALHDSQTNAPMGQSWNLYSTVACNQLADEVYDAIIENITNDEMFVDFELARYKAKE